tara:strand:+ start:32 stop:337 length:306 start_codon:yes stop_codon:yes gene_type:complete
MLYAQEKSLEPFLTTSLCSFQFNPFSKIRLSSSITGRIASSAVSNAQLRLANTLRALPQNNIPTYFLSYHKNLTKKPKGKKPIEGLLKCREFGHHRFCLPN